MGTGRRGGTDAVLHRELVELSAQFSQRFARWLDASPGTLSYPRLRVLEALHCQGPSMMRCLAESVGMSARNLTAVTDTLESEGFVRRSPHPEDRRATLIELTTEGVEAAERSLSPRLRDLSRPFDQLTDGQRAQLDELLRLVITAIDASEPTRS